ncbi:MAG: hypothetical protein DLM57_12455 [Pseudonocardiales bacterium]|nr:MAG: hypothetical protein DLM57_12455 [Pseudonocardiales bacterium]
MSLSSADDNSYMELGYVLAAAQDTGGCPPWCIGAEDPEHTLWFPAPDGQGDFEFDRFHVSAVVAADPVGVFIEQFETRHDGVNESTPPVVKCESGGRDALNVITARQLAASLLNAADLLEQIQEGSL